MTNEQILNTLADIVNDVAGVEQADVQMDKKFADDLDIDSLSMVEIIYECEEKFGVTIPDEAAKQLSKVSDAVNYIANAPAK